MSFVAVRKGREKGSGECRREPSGSDRCIGKKRLAGGRGKCLGNTKRSHKSPLTYSETLVKEGSGDHEQKKGILGEKKRSQGRGRMIFDSKKRVSKGETIFSNLRRRQQLVRVGPGGSEEKKKKTSMLMRKRRGSKRYSREGTG